MDNGVWEKKGWDSLLPGFTNICWCYRKGKSKDLRAWKGPFFLHLSSTCYIHARSCSTSSITLASLNNIWTSLLHNTYLLLRHINILLLNFLLHEYFITNYFTQSILWDKRCYHYIASGIAKYTLKYLGVVFFREYIMLQTFKAAFLLLSVVAGNTDINTLNNILNFQYLLIHSISRFPSSTKLRQESYKNIFLILPLISWIRRGGGR